MEYPKHQYLPSLLIALHNLMAKTLLLKATVTYVFEHEEVKLVSNYLEASSLLTSMHHANHLRHS